MHHTTQDVGACLAARHAAAVSITAGGGSDNSEVDGAYVDARDFGSVKVVIHYTATLAAGETLSIAANLQEDADGTGSGTDVTGSAYPSTVVATGGTGGSTETGVVEMDFDVSKLQRYLRVQFTPDLSASNTDTAIVSAVYILGGAEENPVTASVI